LRLVFPRPIVRKTLPPKNSDPFRFYAGYLPSGEYFRMMADDLVELAIHEPNASLARHNLCFIGLLAFFEAFAKDQLGSILSLSPTAIDRLRVAGYRTEITAREALNLRDEIEHQIGFLISHRLDLGTAKAINAAFTLAIKVTPFAKKEVEIYDKMLRDRNLIIHHGATYTTAYLEQAFDEIDPKQRVAHAYAIRLSGSDVEKAASFLKQVAHDLIDASAKSLSRSATADGSIADESRRKAIEFTNVWGEEAAKIDAELDRQIAEFERAATRSGGDVKE